MAPITLSARQKAGHALSGHQREVFHLESDQLIAAKASPKAQQQEGAVTPKPQRLGAVAARLGALDRLIEPVGDLGELRKLQGFGALLDVRMQGLDALEDLFHDRPAGRIGETMLRVPARQGREALPEGIQ